MSMLMIDQKTFAQIAHHATFTYPKECCGVLLGEHAPSQRVVRQVVRCKNVHPQPEKRYSIDPSELISIQRDARDLKLEIVGFYHSHPDHPPNCSAADMAEAYWAGCSYLITSVEHGRVSASRSFVLESHLGERRLVEETLVEGATQA